MPQRQSAIIAKTTTAHPPTATPTPAREHRIGTRTSSASAATLRSSRAAARQKSTAAATINNTQSIPTGDVDAAANDDDLIPIDQVFEELFMKMEVLSVQNQFQGQFGVIGSTKVKDWTSSFTAPPPPTLTPPASRESHSLSRSPTAQQAAADAGTDVVDGRQLNHHAHHHHHHHHHYYQQQQHQQQQQHHPQHHHPQQQHHHHFSATKMDATAVDGGNHHAVGIGGIASAGSRYAYNNNLLCCDVLATATSAAAAAAASGGGDNTDADYSSITTPVGGGAAAEAAIDSSFCVSTGSSEIDSAAVAELSQRLQAELRAAKSRHLACTEVSLPSDLTPRIAVEIVRTSEREPCGVRGCTIFIEFEQEPNNTRRIASFKVDPNTVSTFELYLTLKQDKTGWTSLLRQFLKNLTRSSTILISPDFTMTKNKLYSCE